MTISDTIKDTISLSIMSPIPLLNAGQGDKQHLRLSQYSFGSVYHAHFAEVRMHLLLLHSR